MWCGECRQPVVEGFGLLYELERQPKRGPRRPCDASKRREEYVPPNSAVCDACWAKVSPSAQRTSSRHVDRGQRLVLAYAPAESSTDPIWGAKTWGCISASRDGLIFLPRAVVAEHLSKALEIIDEVAGRRKPPPPRAEVFIDKSFLWALAEERGRTFDDAFLRDIAEEFGASV